MKSARKATSASRTSGFLSHHTQSTIQSNITNTMSIPIPILIIIACLFASQWAIFGLARAFQYTPAIIAAAAALWLVAALAAAL